MAAEDRITRGRGWVPPVLALIWVALILYAVCAYNLAIGAAFGSRGAAIVLVAAPPVLLVSGTVIAAIGRRAVQAWIFAGVLVLLIATLGVLYAVSREQYAHNCPEPDGHYCAQAPAAGVPAR